MDLVDLMAEKSFLGQEFLTWLWFKSEERGGNIQVPETGDIQLVFEKHMILEYGEGESHEKMTCQGLQSELKEARTGLATGKKIEQARMMLAVGDFEWHFSIKGSLLEYRSMKVPKTVDNADEGNDPEAVEARLLDKLGLYETAIRTLDNLLRLFIKIRIGSDWPEELTKIRAWIHKPTI